MTRTGSVSPRRQGPLLNSYRPLSVSSRDLGSTTSAVCSLEPNNSPHARSGFEDGGDDIMVDAPFARRCSNCYFLTTRYNCARQVYVGNAREPPKKSKSNHLAECKYISSKITDMDTNLIINANLLHTAGLDAQYEPAKNELPANQKGYDNSETTIRKLSGRRTQICRVYFCVEYYSAEVSDPSEGPCYSSSIGLTQRY